MKRCLILLLGGLLAVSAAAQYPNQYPTQSEPDRIEVGGYAAAEYAKSQSEGLFPAGTFHQPLMGFTLTGQPAGRILFRTEVAFRGSDQFDLNQAWVGFQATNYLNLKMGLFVVPFGRINERSRPHEIDLVNLPLNIAVLLPRLWRDIGLTASGNISGLQYTAFLGNGLAEGESLSDGQQFRDNNRNKAWGVRLEWIPEVGIYAGYSYYQAKVDPDDSRRRIMQAASATWTTSDFYVQFEYTHAQQETGEGFGDATAWGYTFQAAMIWRGFRPLAGYQRLDYDDPFHGPGFLDKANPGEGIYLDQTRWVLGAVVALSQQVHIKLEYDFNREKDREIPNDGYFIQVAFAF